ncbi:tripartite motif-containing protein 35-like [Poecilia latipinna]|uniref:Tripartite motif-containing protein 35-like n=1 Tax=Poecilia latipinna TaxID=48699 RepID=A0A3B3TNL0_9TELE|nr:PREDICTED: tripartite motif-containing protein 35-like [Poecilia latipinna]
MASNLEEELSCPVCRDIFRDPVLLSCSHSFCRACLSRWWTQKQIRKCPVCNCDSDRKEPTCNLVLKNTCEAFLLEREDVCQLHSEKLKLFCLDHQQPVCLICRDSKQHSGHVFRPAAEVAQDRREALRKSIMPLQEKLKLFTKVKEDLDLTAQHIHSQARLTEARIRKEFRMLQRVLRDEEEVRVAAVKEEEEQKSLKVNEKIKVLDGVMAALYDTIKSAERTLRCKDAAFLQSSSAAGTEQQRPLPELPQPAAGALIDVAKHLGNLRFNTWKKVKQVVSRTPVILDPNTAGPGLFICEDLAAVRRGSRQKLPGNPERFESEGIISASRGFTAGVHFWTVEVADCSSWFVGVAEESFKRKKPIQFKSGLWAVCFSKEKYSYFSPGAPASFHVTGKLQAIRIHLDLERGKLSFTDPKTLKHICTFSHSWSEKMFPIFYVGGVKSMKILPSEGGGPDDEDSKE